MIPENSPELGGRWFAVSDAWRRRYPGAHVGVLALRGAANPAMHERLEHAKRELEAQLRNRHAGADREALRANPVLRAYAEYYRAFGKTYHVQLQLESIVLKGKSIPTGAVLVEAMFMAELDTCLLTAGHDLAAIQGSLRLDLATGSESYTLLRGAEQVTKPDDMMIMDEAGVISSIIHGPDQRTQIRPETRDAVFTVYAPAGIELPVIRGHMERIGEYARLVSPSVVTALMEIQPT